MALRQTNPERPPERTRAACPASLADLSGERLRTACHCPAAPESSDEVAATLADYLSRRLNCPGLQYEQPPGEISGGWETYTYFFQLKPGGALPESYTRPLTLRVYSCCEGLDRARNEYNVERHVGGLGYPVPGHLFLEEDCHYFGGPFLVAPQVAGPTLLRSAVNKPWMVIAYAMRMAEVQARLHRLPTRGFPRPGGDFLSRKLEGMTRVVGRCKLNELRPGLEWLCAHRPPAPRQPSILHLDFHPLNLLDDGKGGLVVIDWTEADVGDPHADVGQTMMTLECMAEDHPRWYDRFWVGVGRWLFNLSYLYAYCHQLPLDDGRLRYYRALAAFRRLCLYGHWLHVGPTIDGHKPCAIQHLQADHFRVLERYFHQWSAVRVALLPPKGMPLPEPVLL